MREIKFRAWDERNEVMHYDFEFIRSGVEGNDWIIFKSDKQKLELKPHPFENPYFQQQLKIMQFTGLKDLNGKEIYEGDMFQDEEDGNYDFVEWSDHHCGWTTNIWFGSIEFSREAKNMEVVGNIHENKELLK